MPQAAKICNYANMHRIATAAVNNNIVKAMVGHNKKMKTSSKPSARKPPKTAACIFSLPF